MKIVIVGGVAGGASAAARLRRMDETAEIIMFEKGNYISYANCGLPYYIGDTINEREKLFLQTPESFGKRFNMEVRVNSEVLSIDREAKTVSVVNHDNEEVYTETYDKLILSPGAEPVRPPLRGIDLNGILTLRNVPDTDRIKNYIRDNKVKTAVVVGAGFIGLEMAENLHQLGIKVSIVEMAPQVMTPIDFPMAAIVHHHLSSHGVELFLNEAVEAFEPAGKGLKVMLRSKKELTADLVILSIGVRPETKLARESGLKLGETQGIWVNEYMQTSDANIYAVGDAVETINPITGKPSLPYLAGPANKQARICSDNLLYGNKHKFNGSISTAIAKIFDLTVAATGVSAKLLKKNNIPFIESTTHSSSHAGYYPGAIPMSIKITFSPEDGKLYGAQIVGHDGVDKRIDMLATMLGKSGTIYDLMEIEHAYAPPYSSAKDPVNMAGFTAENILAGRMQICYWDEIENEKKVGSVLLDVRTKAENELGNIPGSINIPLDDLRSNLDKLSKDQRIVIYCAVGLRGYIATRILLQNGFTNVVNLSGGYKTYDAAVTTPETAGHQEPEVDTDTQVEVKHAKTIKVDACGLQCPGPIMKLKSTFDELHFGERAEILATDQGFLKDSQSWANITGNKVISLDQKSGIIRAVIEKSMPKSKEVAKAANDGKTMIVFSNDLDKALASFIIANGAASTGKKVTIFFTFWGLSVIRKQAPVKKTLIEKMFGMMLPGSSKALGLSQMQMGGIGPKMIRWVMKSKQVESLETLMQQAIANGVELIACQMSMDVMGIKAEELIDGVQIGGVATYLERAEDANVNLFI
ncbi:MAG: FAD-dependent oxidoreductase [Bacteroidota bacterium]|nr:FAD-dependent oxidoreductase [Bacteroidota bacterium]